MILWIALVVTAQVVDLSGQIIVNRSPHARIEKLGFLGAVE
jgi:hypothetical protein